MSFACQSVWSHSSKPWSASHFTFWNRHCFFCPPHFGLSPKKLWPAAPPFSMQNTARFFQPGCVFAKSSQMPTALVGSITSFPFCSRYRNCESDASSNTNTTGAVPGATSRQSLSSICLIVIGR